MIDPEQNNHYGENPSVARVDLITGKITGRSINSDNDRNSSTLVLHRFYDNDWLTKDDYKSMTYNIKNPRESFYLRVRGTNTSQLEPLPDDKGENPWDDLWFYSNPIFIQVQ